MSTGQTGGLVAEKLCVTYASSRGSVVALEDFSVSLPRGGFLSVIGPSGCGKSTLLRLLAGLLKPTRGSAMIDGEPITGPRRDVGIVFQQPTLMPWHSIMENVLLPIRTLDQDIVAGREKAAALLKLVGLENFTKHFPHELSGGMQQRVAIARSLVHDPSLLLMDEPFAALDALTRELMMLELQRIWMLTGKTIVFITHSIPEAVFLSDRVLVLSPRPGRVVEDLRITLERPRDFQTMGSTAFGDLGNHLRELIGYPQLTDAQA